MQWSGIKFSRVEAESRNKGNFTSMAIKLDILDMVPADRDGGLKIAFTYSVDYKPDIASMKFSGYLLLKGTRDELARLSGEWKKDKTIPRNVAEPLINVVKFNAETNGVLVAKAIGIVPPLLAPRIEIGPVKRTEKAGAVPSRSAGRR